MADIRDKLRAQIGQRPAGALPGAGHKALEDRLRDQAGAQQEKERAAQYAAVDVYLVTDATGSMDYLIATVREGAEKIGAELFNHPDRGETRISISAVRDHGEGAEWFQQGTLRSTLAPLQRDISAVRCYGGSDGAEAYECAWLQLAREISQNSGQRKRVVVFAGDNLPHGYKVNPQAQRRVYVDDAGCPHQVDYRTSWQALTTAAELTLFVGCHEAHRDDAMIEAQRSIVAADDPRQRYVDLGNIGDIPALIMATTRLAQSNAAARDYIARLALEDSERAGRIKGYLGVKNGS
jgi:hypothetical protein